MQGLGAKNYVQTELPKSTSCPDSISGLLTEKQSKEKTKKFFSSLHNPTSLLLQPKIPEEINDVDSTHSSKSQTQKHYDEEINRQHQKSKSFPNKRETPKTFDLSFSLFSLSDSMKSISPPPYFFSNSTMPPKSIYSSASSTSSYSSNSTVASSNSSPSSSPPPPSESHHKSNRYSGEYMYSQKEWDDDEQDDLEDEFLYEDNARRKNKNKDHYDADEYKKNLNKWSKFSSLIPKDKRPTTGLPEGQGRARVHSDTSSMSSMPSTTSVSVSLNFPTRPLDLPPKNQNEQKKHRKMHEEMMKIAKIREEKENKKNEEREKIMTVRTMLWENHILPYWETKRSTRRTAVLWEQGLPPKVRGRVWKNAIGNSLNITEELFQICVDRADVAKKSNLTKKIGREESVELIKTDLHRTFPTIRVFQPGGPFHDSLEKVLQAYACYRADIGYVQGMSFIASLLLLNMEEFDAFVCLCNLLNRSSLLVFYQLESFMIQAYMQMFTQLGRDILPDIFNHFQKVNLEVNIFLLDWILTIYSKSLSLENSSRIWDCFFLYGDFYLFKAALGILKHLEKKILNQPFDSIAFELTHLPPMDEDQLFESINSIPLGDKRYQIACNKFLPKVS